MLGGKCAFLLREAECQPNTRIDKGGGKVSGALGFVSQDSVPPATTSMLRKGRISSRSKLRHWFTEDTIRSINIQERKRPSLGVIQTTHLHKGNLQHGSWPKTITKTEETWIKIEPLISPSEVWVPQCICLSQKDWHSAVLKTVRVIQKQVITAGGEVRRNEEASLYVKDLGSFVTVQFLEDTPPVLSHGQLCERSWVLL